jgi:hypothetical protein
MDINSALVERIRVFKAQSPPAVALRLLYCCGGSWHAWSFRSEGGVGVVAAAAGAVSSSFDVVPFRGRPGRRVVVGGALGGCGGAGQAAALMAASTSGKHLGMFLAPFWRPLDFSRVML